MKPARTLMIATVAASLIAVSCTSDGFDWSRNQTEPVSQPITQNEPAPDATAAPNETPPPAPAEAQAAPEAAPLNERIQTYVGRFPADDLERKTTDRTPVDAESDWAPADSQARSAATDDPGSASLMNRPSNVNDSRTAPPGRVYGQPAPVSAQASPANLTGQAAPGSPGISRSAGPSPTGNTPAAPQGTLAPMTPARTSPNQATRIDTSAGQSTASPPSSPMQPITPQPQGNQTAPRTVAPGTLDVEITDIRPASAVAPNNTSQDVTPSPNAPARPGTPARPTDLKSVIADLEETLAERPPHPEDQFRLRLLYLAAGEEDKATSPIEGMDPIQAELLSAVFQTVTTARQAMLKPTESNPEALTAAEDLRRLLGQQSGVVIPRTALVTRVTSFGDYEPISPLRFQAGRDIHAYVYTEVANFRSEPAEDGRLRTLLSEKIEVFDSTGKLVWSRTESNIEDRVKTPRRDFFIPFPVHLPPHLATGEYVLKVTIEDRLGGTTDQQRLTFSVHK